MNESPSFGLARGQVVGGRFEVESQAAADATGVVMAARDQKTGKPIALRVLRPGLVPKPDGVKILRQHCRSAAQLNHRNIAATYGVGSAGGGAQFIAAEWVDGATLDELIRRRVEAGGSLSLRGAFHIVEGLASALGAAHTGTCHGAVRPSAIWVSRDGKVKLGDFGVGRALLAVAGARAFDPADQARLAPEVKAGSDATPLSDIFGLGAVLYELLTGRSPADGFVPPSQVHPEASEDVDQVLFRCLGADPGARFDDPKQVRDALAPLADATNPAPFEQDFLFGTGTRAVAPKSPPPAQDPAQAPRPGAAAPAVGARVSIHEEFRPSVAEAPPPAASAEVDLKDLLSKITENDAPRWMVVKDNLDHGPFSGRELVNMILKGEVLGDHGLLNMDTGERKKVREFTEFSEFLAQFELKKEQQAQHAELVRADKVEKASSALKFVIAAGVVGVLAVVTAVFLVTLQSADDDPQAATDARADLFDRGEIEITGSAGILPEPRRRGGRGMRGGGMGGGGGGMGGNLSYEEAMERAVNLGDLSMGGGERQLTSGDVAGVMNRHINSFFGCVSQELRRGGSLGTVQIDLAIAGSGQVLGASTRQGSPQFRSCIASRVRNVRFPSFPAPRMGARFSFSVN
ncbi:MAG: protein kinase [Myxococcota bacterium]